DTIKRVDADGRVVETVDRAPLRAVQTPQAFAGPLLRRAHLEVTGDATDDASMLERIGVPVMTVAGDPENLKVTTPADLVLARAWLTERGR
ncbi:MAG: 2-C-methyl-D-erythritol 4-phosphate cytidylyltransferase, partial [Dehalococcoidia bacterium]|nr:2-C-methyl-D-erythritol 4-phosphate cytidylyltransferase [Dehalococcoidia bacterium]